ncbi:MAG: ABC transporter permease subunit [Alphaproteobacteria bacterium]|nr:ABC transporter permease subunit [Alphaproteobacteria bacterium]
MRLRAVAPWLWLTPAGALLIPFFAIPLAVTIRNSVYRDDPTSFMVPDATLANYVKLLSDPYYLGVFANTLGVAALVSAIALAIAYPFAQLMARVSTRVRAMLFWAVFLPLYVSIIMRVFGWIVIIADSGMLNQMLLGLGLIREPVRLLYEFEGMTLGILHRYLPLMIVPLVTSLRKVDVTLLKASANLGATGWFTWRRIVLPVSLPGAVAGVQLVFAGVLSDYVIPSLMGSTKYQLVAPAIYYEAVTNGSWALAGAMATLVLGTVASFLAAANLLMRRFAPWAGSLGGSAVGDQPVQPTSWASRFFAGFVVLFLVGPILIAAAVAFSSGDRLEFPPPGLSLKWFGTAIANSQFIDGLVNSALVAAGAAALAAIAGTGAAVAINHYRFPARAIVQTVVMLPITLPAIVLGLGLLFTVSTYGLRPGLIALTIGHGVIGLPYVTAMVLAAFANYDRALERASLNLGIGPVRTFCRITLPLIRHGILAGAAVAFMMSFDNISLSLFIAKGNTLPLRLMQQLLSYADPSVAAISTLVLAASLALVTVLLPALAAPRTGTARRAVPAGPPAAPRPASLSPGS